MPRVIPVLGCILVAQIVQAQTPAATDNIALGRATVERLSKADYAAVLATFDDTMKAALGEDKLKASWETALAQLGAFKSAGQPRATAKGEFRVVIIPVEFERAGMDVQVAINGKGQIAGLALRPATVTSPFTDASYVDPAAFSDREVTVDAGGWPLPATLSMPNGAGPFPGIVLVHGSGPNDRDETLGPNKPFRDLARGLASRGIAVLRYEKRTRQHGAKIQPLKQFTVKEETVDDAVAAVKVMRATNGIDPKRVFVLGHSLGGMLAPRIAMAAPGEIAGLVIMAGAVRSLEQSLIDQTRYMANADGKISPEEQKQIAQVESLAAAVKALEEGDPPPSIPGISAPVSYWLDLRGYDPPAAARSVKVPMLILQGGRDYQVTTGDFEKWKAALGDRKDVTARVYPALNHLFVTGTGASMPAEYLTPGHVDEGVVRDIAEWVRK
jgi:dienelactone hydrolase